ncbi:fumarylacetoacetate hydrolase family protein [Nesterenkonia natronophila]|uniref:FAA hydrolase family protein n=1 Tax=Nesterenkonia natronophila TaxID=2174932 RepID=A0A3A4F2C4_9MICC|nr:fumarylacetoacetate hydrolase family protein [Nesterenkonia natronophila]RJN32442.1 FAA hydrolase family protein [Nesterenkonia natronophila]
MKLATLHIRGKTVACVQTESDFAVVRDGDVSSLMEQPEWRSQAAKAAESSSRRLTHAEAVFAPLVTTDRKIICCGLNYADHISEMGRELPEHPTLFAKFADTLCGANDRIEVRASEKVDWEAELAVMVGSHLHEADEAEASAAIAGYAVANDVSMRDWQNRTTQWLQGKAFDATTPVGPVLVTADEFGEEPIFDVYCYVNDEQVQHGDTSRLVFPPAKLLAYVSTFTQLRPGDLILTGTPGGVGAGAKPPRFLADGDFLRTEIPGVGSLRNQVRVEGMTSEESCAPDLERRQLTHP